MHLGLDTALAFICSALRWQEKVEFIVPPEGVDIGEQLYFDGVEGGPFEPVSAAQMEKKKVLDNVLPVREQALQTISADVVWPERTVLPRLGYPPSRATSQEASKKLQR